MKFLILLNIILAIGNVAMVVRHRKDPWTATFCMFAALVCIESIVRAL